ncbi:MAG TPA: NADH-quinone oxidoreductase subunit L, partial [Alphaproteobacteria bacterium]
LFLDVILDTQPRTVHLAAWMTAGDFKVDWALRVDQLAVVMMCVVNIVSACVHFYSIGYMSHDACKARFMSYLSLFTFAMLMLVTSDNLVQMFFGWEGVGVASYLLIGFWNHKHSANAAAVKAFVVNRVGDFGLALGVFATFAIFGSVQFDAVFTKAPELADLQFMFMGFPVHALTLICLLLFMGACGKSAQLGLHTWLPDAMEGPTPVSALIHAATMVTAGVFLVARMSPVFEYAPVALMVVTVVGASTAFVAATIGLTQFDIKRVIAYSTMSQLGYMFFALGVSAYGAAIFHLMTHAFFKALLFLGAGSVIHAMSDEQDMRRMGGIWRQIPVTYALMWIGSLALAGIPFFAGYYSKDIILESAFADHTWFGNYAYWMGIAAALMTAFYSWRLIFMTFHGKPRADEKVMAHIHESPTIMIAPLIILATGAIFAGAFFYNPFVAGEHEPAPAHAEAQHHEEHASVWNYDAFWGSSLRVLPENNTLQAAHHVPEWAKLLPTAMGVLGISLAWVVYIWRAGIAARIAAMAGPLHQLFFRKWYFDEIYDAVFVENAWRIGQVFSLKGDRRIIDGYGPDGVALVSQNAGAAAGRFQSGYLYHYAFVMMLGLVALVSWIIFRAGV